MNARASRGWFLICGLLALARALASDPLPRANPESQGLSSAGLLRFIDGLDQKTGGIHGLMLLRHGHVVLEGSWAPYDASTRHELYSLSKSFTSAAVGFAVAEGLFGIDDPVLRFFPDEAPPEPSANLRAMRVRDLLTMACGHQDESPVQANEISVKRFLAHPVPHKPGTHFRYNTPATFLLSAIVQVRSGQSVLDYLQPRLFQPLGIEKPTWDTNAAGISLGGYGLSVRTEDIARFGELHLRKGHWQGRSLLPASWVELATSRQVSNGSNPESDWEQGYGFQFWRCRHGAYRGDGAFGQFCIVLPDQDAVLAITSGLGDMQAVLNRVWSDLLPLFKPDPLAPDDDALRQLRARLKSLSLPLPKPASGTPAEPSWVGRSVRFETNPHAVESIRLEKAPHGWDLVQAIAGKVERIPVGAGSWRSGTATVEHRSHVRVATAGAWMDPDTFEYRMALVETPFVKTHRLRVQQSRATLESSRNVGFGGTAPTRLDGHLD